MKETVVSPTLQPRLAVQPEDIKTVGNDMSAFDHEEKSWRYTEDGLDVTRGSAWSAPGCHLGCGVLVYSKDGEVVRVEGDPENLYDVMDLNINNLISWSSGKTGVGTNYKCILCKIYPVKEGE